MKRIIPIFTFKGNVLVKSKKFKNYRNVNSLNSAIKLFSRRNIDEIIFLNLNDHIDFYFLKSFVLNVDVPITYGGNIESIEVMKQIYSMGFDKISLNSLIYLNFDLVLEASKCFGKQSMVGCIDVKYVDNNYYCFYNNGSINSMFTIFEILNKIIENNVFGEILINDIDNDGLINGFNLDLFNKLEDFNISIIPSGGGNLHSSLDVAKLKNVNAICFSSLFFFTQTTPKDIKTYLNENGIKTVNLVN
jgi:cyclase